jgi:hypothetical protein
MFTAAHGRVARKEGSSDMVVRCALWANEAHRVASRVRITRFLMP